jgi:hypothetical protein
VTHALVAWPKPFALIQLLLLQDAIKSNVPALQIQDMMRSTSGLAAFLIEYPSIDIIGTYFSFFA